MQDGWISLLTLKSTGIEIHVRKRRNLKQNNNCIHSSKHVKPQTIYTLKLVHPMYVLKLMLCDLNPLTNQPFHMSLCIVNTSLLLMFALSSHAVTVSAVYGTVERSFSPLPVVNTTAGARPEVCSTSDNSSNTG